MGGLAGCVGLSVEACVHARALEAGLRERLGYLFVVGVDCPLVECRDELVEVHGRLPRLDGVRLRPGRILSRHESLR